MCEVLKQEEHGYGGSVARNSRECRSRDRVSVPHNGPIIHMKMYITYGVPQGP